MELAETTVRRVGSESDKASKTSYSNMRKLAFFICDRKGSSILDYIDMLIIDLQKQLRIGIRQELDTSDADILQIQMELLVSIADTNAESLEKFI